MIKSNAWRKLSGSAKEVYIICRMNIHDSHAKRILHNHGIEFGTDYNENSFVIPSCIFEEYGIKRSNGSRALKELQSMGFIKISEQNKPRKKVNVYEFDTKWKSI